MLRRTLLSLPALALCLAACGGDDAPPDTPPDVASVAEMRVVKVSGDQTAPVPGDAGSPAAGVLYAEVGTDGYTDEPLVARVEDTAPPSASLAGPSFAIVPAGTDVHWHLEDGCGDLFGATTETDDTAYVVNRWAPGTVAGTCTADAGRLVGDSIVIDATWELEVLPGAIDTATAAYWGIVDSVGPVPPPQWWAYVEGARLCNYDNFTDAYGNRIPYYLTATQYLTVSADTAGVDCMLAVGDTTVAAGDTATMRVFRLSDDSLLLDLLWTAAGGIEHPEWAPEGIVHADVTARVVNY